MKIHESQLWKHPELILTILKNSPPLDSTIIFTNPKLFYIKQSQKIISFLTIKKHSEFHELKTVYTFLDYRNKGYSKKIINHIIPKYSLLVLQCNSKLEEFYKKSGFKRVDKLFKTKTLLFKILIKPIFKYKLITMKKG